MIRWALAGVALVGVAAAILVMVVRLVSADRTDVTDLEVGRCFELALDDGDAEFATIDLVDTVDCADPHTAQVVATGELNPGANGAYPGDQALLTQVDERCSQVADDPRFGLVPVVPTETTWNGRRGRYLCVALAYGGIELTGDHTAVRP